MGGHLETVNAPPFYQTWLLEKSIMENQIHAEVILDKYDDARPGNQDLF